MKHKIFPILVVLSLAAVVAVVWAVRGFTFTPLEESADRQDIQEIPFNTSVPALKKYRLQRIWVREVPSWLPLAPANRPVLVLVDPKGEMLEMPTEFDKLVRRESLSVSSPTDARDLAVTYVTLTAPFGKVLVLSELGMVPAVKQNPPRQPIEVEISPPVVKRSEQKYVVQLFTWKELGGVLEEWTITLSEDGGLQARANQLATHVGKAVGLQ